jgi:hypothetical protein
MTILVPRPIQKPMIQFMLDNPRCCIFAGCGTGKTSSGLLVADMLPLLGLSKGPSLVCGPMRVARDVWHEDAEKWENFNHMKIRWIGGTPGERFEILRARPFADVYTISYELLPWLVQTLQDKFPFRTVIADESDALKGFRLAGRHSPSTAADGRPSRSGRSSVRAYAIARVAHTLVDRWVNFTGTPAPNGLGDLWGQMWFIDRGQRLGLTHGAFMSRWFKQNPYSRRIEPFPHSEKEIHAALKDICLTLDAKDYFDLHTPIVVPMEFNLPPGARRIYDRLEKTLFAELATGTEVEVFNEAALSNKCLQLANGAIYTTYPQWEEVHDAKIEILREIVAESGGAPVLVAYQFKSDAARILKAFPAAAILAEPAGLAKFKAGEAQLGIAHPKSLGHGVDGLHLATNILVRFGHGWDLGQRIQMLERIGPMRQFQAGFDRAVFVYDIIARKTLDVEVIARHKSKVSVQEALLNAMNRER